MTQTGDRVTRVAADLMDSAAAEGARQSRSAKQQLDHWARVGREVSSQQTAARRRVEAALTGELELRELSVEEGAVFNAEIAAAIQENLAESNYGEQLAARGVTTVALDEKGDIVEHRPDGSSITLTAKQPRRRKASAAPAR
jgi:ParD-like antitoxin of type II bacterial toxin-antitoxin system